ncbi:galactosylceramide sulfotransferase-like [Ptychodera flava]|uniref:galactosylceramide sulfotransferase-like n=1 Tax=Ptychodera flava TaxID=63121 RepID=UPI003969E7CE
MIFSVTVTVCNKTPYCHFNFLIISLISLFGIGYYTSSSVPLNFQNWQPLGSLSSNGIDENASSSENTSGDGNHYIQIAMTRSGDICRPQHNFVFIKTAKTGGSTLSSMLYRYGLKNNLLAALDPNNTAFIDTDDNGNLILKEYNCHNFSKYNFMASHVTYNRQAMDMVIENAKHFTILRSPVTHWKSHFYFGGKDKAYPNTSNPFQMYLKELYAGHDKGHTVRPHFNGYCNRFGISYGEDTQTMNRHLELLDNELDLVLLMEYYDESLILLKQLMCWDFEDILYYPMKVHKTKQPPITPEMTRQISQLARFDVRLYDYFNSSFWSKIENYHGDFQADLRKFKNLKQDVVNHCENIRHSQYCDQLMTDTKQMANYVRKRNAKQLSC